MAVVWIEGFEGFGVTNGNDVDFGGKYTNIALNTQMDIAAGRLTGHAMRFAPNPNGATARSPDLGAMGTVTVGFAVKHAALAFTTMLALYDGTSQGVTVELSSNGTGNKWELTRAGTVIATASTAPSTGTWYYVEFSVLTDGTSGTAELRVDGATVATFSGNTKGGSNNSVNKIQFMADSNSADYMIDDVYVRSDATFMGNMKVLGILPTSDNGSPQWTPSTGTDHFAVVDENPQNGDTDYISDTTTGNQDLFDYASLSGLNTSIVAQINTTARSTSGTVTGYSIVKSSASQSDGSAFSYTTSYSTSGRIVDTDPATSADWTSGGISAAKFGVKSAENNTLRVTRQQVEVLTTNYSITEIPVSDTLTFTQDVDTNQIIESASSVLSLSQTVQTFGVKSFSVSSDLGISDEVARNVVYNRGFSDDLDLSSDHTRSTDHTQYNLPIAADYDVQGRYLRLNQDVVVAYVKRFDVATFMPLHDVAGLGPSIRNFTVSSALNLVGAVRKAIELDVASVLEFEQDAIRVLPVSSSLSFTQTVTSTRGKPTENTLVLDQAVTRQMVFTRPAANSLGFNQSVAFILIKPNTTCIYHPFVGGGEGAFFDEIIGVDPEPPELEFGMFTMIYPPTGFPLVNMPFRNPEFGNRIAYTPNRINRETRSGTKIIFKDPDWPEFTVLKFDFSGLTATQVTNFRDLVTLSLGKDIKIIDHSGRVWVGIITTPNIEFTQLGGREAGCEDFACSFEFEGDEQ